MRTETKCSLPQQLGALNVADNDSLLAENGFEVAYSIKTAKPAPPGVSSSFRRKKDNHRHLNNHVDRISKQMAAGNRSPQEIGKFVAEATGFNEKK